MEKARIMEILNNTSQWIMAEGKHYVVDEHGTTRVGMMSKDLSFTVCFRDNMIKLGEIQGVNAIAKILKVDHRTGFVTDIEIVPEEVIDEIKSHFRKLG